ncbi:hypothetical protein GCM10023310_69880 [Paenibacillus vulneris]
MHTFVKVVNGYNIKHWSLGNVYYIIEKGKWLFEHKDLEMVEDYANTIRNEK